MLGPGLGADGERLRPRWARLALHRPGPAAARSEGPGPTRLPHTGTCQGLASQRLEGAPAGDFKSPNAFQKELKLSAEPKPPQEENSLAPFFLSLFIFQPAGLVILFFSYYKRSQLQHRGKKKKKNHLPGLGRGLLQPQPPGWPPAADKGGSRLRHPLGEAPEPLP